ncbi:hypothetical protein [Bacillus sp. N6]|uniref:hypothetical protein n=1 Tax=Bacillus sp. N6 TaxID=127893 RepID=UPI004055CE86
MKNKTYEYFKDMTKWYYEKQLEHYEVIIWLLQSEGIKYRFVYDDVTSPVILMDEDDFFGWNNTLTLRATADSFTLRLGKYTEEGEKIEVVKVAESKTPRLIVDCIKSLHFAHHLGLKLN